MKTSYSDRSTALPDKPSNMDVRRGIDLDEYAVMAKKVGKTYRLGSEHRWVIRDIDFVVQNGECVFLVGPSGSGKSTLLSILGCLLTPDEGEVMFRGTRTSALSASEQAEVRRQNLGFVFQRFQLIRGLSAIENVAVPLTLQGVSMHESLKYAGNLLERVGLWQYRDSLPTKMSPGQCQRVAIARALIGNPSLVLADEPTASLDEKSGREAMELLRALVKETGASAVVVTHDSRIFEFADRVCAINNGHLESTTPSEAIPTRPTEAAAAFPSLSTYPQPSFQLRESP
jgi:putative ABC transport system ATP-binding protein